MAAFATSETAAAFFAPLGALGAQRAAKNPRAMAPAAARRIVPVRLVFMMPPLLRNVSPLPALDHLAGVLGLRLRDLLVLGEGLPELRDRLRLLFLGEDDLPRQDHLHGPRRLVEEVVEGSPEARLHVLHRGREV